MMKVQSVPLLVDEKSIPVYPIPLGERLDSHYFVLFDFQRWLNSNLRLKASPEVRAFALDLFFIAQNQSPVGTLPDDYELLAKLLMIDLAAWNDLCKREMTPLYNWSPCMCGGEIRLAHPVVTEKALEAFNKKRSHSDARARERERKRLGALQKQILDAGGHSAMAGNASYVEHLDKWLEKNSAGNRTPSRVREAMEAIDSAK